MSVREFYSEGRERVTGLLRSVGEGAASVSVPACPDWTVADVVAHLAGACADVLAGRIEGVATPPWTAAQVEARRGRSMVELLDEWTQVGAQVEAIVEYFPEWAAQQWIADLTTHEHDIRSALHLPGARDAAVVAESLDFVAGVGFRRAVVAQGLPAVAVRSGKREWGVEWASKDLGDTGAPMDSPVARDVVPSVTVAGDAYELLRSFTGRRSLRQIAALDWSDDPRPFLATFSYGPFAPSSIDVVE